MNKSPGVLIIGGGVAGMSAARLLADYNVSVHVVEKRDRLGGHSAMWPCMATEACVNCGACLSIEMAALTSCAPNVSLHLCTCVSVVDKSEKGFDVTLENGEKFNVQKIIAATGFSPFDPARIASYHTDSQKNIITTTKLNTLLKKEALGEQFGGNPSPQIAFIQCVGSRNRKIGNDYCSQVCCKVAMRHANKLLHLMPDARITIFYMDLQLIGKETRSFYNGLTDKINLVQGVPAEVLENRENGKLRIITENRDDMSRVAKEYDMVVLTVGMERSQNLDKTAGLLGVSPNSWGFFNTQDAISADDIYIAGCARTPTDILSSMQDGRIAAGRVIDELGLLAGPTISAGSQPLSVAVFGSGTQAVEVAGTISANGCKTWLLGAGDTAENIDNCVAIPDARILQVSGTAGNFNIHLQSGGTKQNLLCGAIIAAFESDLSDNSVFASENAITPQAFSGLISENPGKCPDDIVMLLDYNGPEYKKWVRMSLEDGLKAKAAGKKVTIVANKILVHKADGQRLYDKARKNGVTFLRYEKPGDVKVEKTSNGFVITLKEATLPASLDIRLECGCLVLPPKLVSSAGFAENAVLLKERVDKEGFLQSSNVRHRLTQSPRKGIFFAGTCHDETDDDDLTVETREILTLLKKQSVDLREVETGVKINEKMCAQCLTCYRICPHGAIVLTETMRPRIVPDACFSCHLCVANCPAYAIESEQFPKEAFGETVAQGKVVIFACERSGFLAACDLSLPDHVNLVKIPCACRINSDVILKSLLNGASKVIIAGCYEGNCRSMEGAHEAAIGVAQVRRIPGMEGSRIAFESVAANEAVKIKRIISKA